MILEELNLIGFGKFEHKIVKFKNGINLIYGENESGKSTIHSFIDGMFYGFLRPNVKSTLYLDKHKQYDPWNSNRYAGILRFKYKDQRFRIEREFKKGRESTRILEENTGKNITKDIDTGKRRILQPGIHFFGFNSNVFSNTIFIKQLGTLTDDKIAKEITEKIVNLSTALDDEISVENAILNLKLSIEEIGTERAYTKPYARNIKKIKKLEEEKEKILLQKDNYESLLGKKTKLLENINMEEKNLLRFQTLRKKKILQESKSLLKEIEEMKSHISQPSSYISFIEEDYNKYEKLEEKKNQFIYNKENNKLEFLKRDYISYRNMRKKHIMFSTITGLLAIVLQVFKKFVFVILLSLIFIYLIIKSISYKKVLEKLDEEIQELENEERIKEKEIDKIDEIQTEILSKYRVGTKVEFQGLVSKFHMKEISRERSIRELEVKEELLKRILGNYTIEGLELELEDMNMNTNEEIHMEKLEEDMEKSKEKIKNMKIELKGVEASFNILEKEVSKLVEIEEEIYRSQQYKLELDKKIEALNLAISTIEELSQDIHNQFAPGINEKVGKIIGEITNGKYRKVRISEDLEILVENPITKETIDIDNLSGGTIDQLYFALRFGLINSMVEEKFPLILDDCFIQYDDKRLKNIIKFLSKVGKERQIILFTCHKREKNIMEEMDIDFNLVNLT